VAALGLAIDTTQNDSSQRYKELWKRIAVSYFAATATRIYEAPADYATNQLEIQAGCYGAFFHHRIGSTTQWAALIKDEAGAGVKWATGGTQAKGVLYDIIESLIGTIVPITVVSKLVTLTLPTPIGTWMDSGIYWLLTQASESVLIVPTGGSFGGVPTVKWSNNTTVGIGTPTLSGSNYVVTVANQYDNTTKTLSVTALVGGNTVTDTQDIFHDGGG
jgi:hypothetical protein